MPNCFTLTPIGATEPQKLTEVDEAICGLLKVDVHPTAWVAYWYDSIGLALAMGKSWDEQREIFKDSPTLLRIIDFLESNYTTNAWYQHRVRADD